MILSILKVFNLIIWIAFLACEAYCLYMFCMGEKREQRDIVVWIICVNRM